MIESLIRDIFSEVFFSKRDPTCCKKFCRSIQVIQIQTGLGDPSSDVPSSSTSVMILTGTGLPNVFLLLCSAFRCPPPSSDFGTKGLNQGVCVRHANCVNAMCFYTHADVALITLPQRWLNTLSVQGISERLISE